MKPREIRELSIQELEDNLSDKAEELANLKFQHALHQLDNTGKVRIAKRELARLKTIYNEHKSGIRTLSDEESENTGEKI
ncbi:MAG: 50S ribosomal protein L29 [Candidatus Hatepunaea meridiana]|nr:50S ribosomal protein L29 [Candidatus Hatepunaea meridiana]